MHRPVLVAVICLGALRPAAGHDGAQVVVRGRRSAPSAGATTVGREALDQVRARSAADLLRQAPGLAVSRHGGEGKGAQFFLRGFDAVHGSDLEVCLQGIPLNEPGNVHGHGYVDLGLVIPEAVRALRVNKGAFMLDQGDFSTAGRVDFRLTPPAGLRPSVQVDRFGRVRGAATWARSRDFAVGEAVATPGFGEQRAARRAAALAQLEIADGLDVLLGLASARFELPAAVRRDDLSAGRMGFYDSYTDDTAGESDQALLAALGHLHRGAVALDGRVWVRARRLRLEENYTGFLVDPVGGDRRVQRDDRAEVGLRGDLRWAGPRLGLRLHGRARHTWASVAEAGLPEDATPIPRRDLDQHLTGAGVGLEGEASLPGALTLAAGARADGWAVALQDHLAGTPADAATWALAPRIRGTWRPGPLDVFAAWGRGLRPPDPAQAVAGGLTPVVADQAELGLAARPGPTRLSLAVFQVDIAREALFDHPSGLTVERGATRRRGVELAGQAALGPARLRADVAWVDARFTADGAPVPNAPRLRAAGGVAHGGSQGLQLGVRAEYLGPRPLNYGARSGTTLRLDAHLGWRFRAASLRLDLENLLNRQDADLEGQFASRWDRSGPGDPLPALHAFALPPFGAQLTLTFDLDGADE
ncbi:MAG: TonB-dependent receptor [Myxococcales bacterium]|nr:TonB-dependent receptor [Myxococcales bacterium]